MSSRSFLDLAVTSERIGLCLASTLNCILLILLVFKSNSKFGTYKYLMISYTVIELLYSSIGYFSSAGAHSTNTTYVVFRIYHGPNRTVAPIFILQYCAAIFVLLLVLAVHFIYRYIAVCDTTRLFLFKGHRILYWILGSIGVGIFASALKYVFLGETPAATEQLRREFLQEYGLKMEHVCYNGPNYYVILQLDSAKSSSELQNCNANGCTKDVMVWAVSFFILISLFFCLFLMTTFGYFTYSRLNKSYTNLSYRTCQVQHQLLTALIIQAGIPIIFMYIPIAILFTSPMFGIGFGAYGNVTMACLAVYPPLDQVATMYVIRDFRDAIRNVLSLAKRDLSRVSASSQSTEMHANWRNYQANN